MICDCKKKCYRKQLRVNELERLMEIAIQQDGWKAEATFDLAARLEERYARCVYASTPRINCGGPSHNRMNYLPR